MLNWHVRVLKAEWLLAAVGLLALACGGKVQTELTPPSASSTSNDSDAATSTTGGAPSTDLCADSGLDEGGCAGEGAVDPGTGFHVTCNRSSSVPRNGTPLPICFHIR